MIRLRFTAFAAKLHVFRYPETISAWSEVDAKREIRIIATLLVRPSAVQAVLSPMRGHRPGLVMGHEQHNRSAGEGGEATAAIGEAPD